MGAGLLLPYPRLPDALVDKRLRSRKCRWPLVGSLLCVGSMSRRRGCLLRRCDEGEDTNGNPEPEKEPGWFARCWRLGLCAAVSVGIAITMFDMVPKPVLGHDSAVDATFDSRLMIGGSGPCWRSPGFIWSPRALYVLLGGNG
jgi:hypothetical protein